MGQRKPGKFIRRQNSVSMMVWAAVPATGKSPLVFVPSQVKLDSQRYISNFLEVLTGHVSTLMERRELPNKIPRCHMAQK